MGLTSESSINSRSKEEKQSSNTPSLAACLGNVQEMVRVVHVQGEVDAVILLLRLRILAEPQFPQLWQ